MQSRNEQKKNLYRRFIVFDCDLLSQISRLHDFFTLFSHSKGRPFAFFLFSFFDESFIRDGWFTKWKVREWICKLRIKMISLRNRDETRLGKFVLRSGRSFSNLNSNSLATNRNWKEQQLSECSSCHYSVKFVHFVFLTIKNSLFKPIWSHRRVSTTTMMRSEWKEKTKQMTARSFIAFTLRRLKPKTFTKMSRFYESKHETTGKERRGPGKWARDSN